MGWSWGRATLVVSWSCVVACTDAGFDVAASDDAAAGDTSTAGDALGTDTTTTDTRVGDTTIGADAIREVAPDAPPPDGEGCTASLPPFLRNCSGDGECAFGLHRIDCCGNEKAIAYHESQKAPFDAAELVFRDGCPAVCKCALHPTLTESGSSASEETSITARCVSSMCKTGVIGVDFF